MKSIRFRLVTGVSKRNHCAPEACLPDTAASRRACRGATATSMLPLLVLAVLACSLGDLPLKMPPALRSVLPLAQPALAQTCVTDGAPCDDGNACTSNDICYGGTCVGGNTASGCTACQAVASIPAQGGTFSGITSGTGTLAGSCNTSTAAPERVYSWIPALSGYSTIETCSSSTLYDTLLHVHSNSCTGPQIACNDDTRGCVTGEPSTGHGSRVILQVTAGQRYLITVDGFSTAGGAYSLIVTSPSLCGNGIIDAGEECDGTNAAGCASGACTEFCACAPPVVGGMPDLVPVVSAVSTQFNTTVASGDVVEGCAEALSGVDLMRFTTTTWNFGNAPIQLGDPMCPSPCTDHPLEVCGNPLFICSPAQGHNHAHYANFARYELFDGSGQTVVVGHKQGFCLLDGCGHTCTNQGINPGCSDVYSTGLGCQYLDITGVPNGSYTLSVTLDPLNQMPESDETNNSATLPVTIARSNTTTSTPTITAAATSTRTPTPGAATPTPTATPAGAGGCAGVTTIPATGGTFTGATTGTSTLFGSCAFTSTAPERVFQWTPDVSGVATIQTCGSATTFDTVMYLRSASCSSGTEVVCNDDTAGCSTGEPNDHHGSRLMPAVTAGQTYFIVVDGYSGASGNFTLAVIPPAGPIATPTSTQTQAPTATRTQTPTASATSTVASSATPTSSPLATSTASATPSPSPTPSVTSTVAVTGTPTSSPLATDTASATPSLSPSPTPSVATTAAVTGTPTSSPLATSTASATPFPSPTPSVTETVAVTGTPTSSPLATDTASATPSPSATPSVTSTVAATATPTSSPLATNTASTPTRTPSATPTATPTSSTACGNATLIPSTGGTFSGTTAGSSTLSGTCANTGNAPEKVFRWVPSVSGTATIATCGSGTLFDTVVYMRSGNCDTGTQVACNDDACADGENGTPARASRITPQVQAGQTYFIVVDGFNSKRGAFTLTVTLPQPPAACSAATVIPASGGVFSGATSGASSLAGTCALTSNAPEAVFQWTPSSSGTATIQTCGAATTFDTVVYLRGADCAVGAELACNDDTAGCGTGEPNDHHGSRIAPAVTAGQTYFIVVDGNNGGSGSFSLGVTPPP